jgi:protein TonB
MLKQNTPWQKIQKRRTLFFNIGLVIALAGTFAAFQIRVPIYEELISEETAVAEDVVIIPATQHAKKKVEVPVNSEIDLEPKPDPEPEPDPDPDPKPDPDPNKKSIDVPNEGGFEPDPTPTLPLWMLDAKPEFPGGAGALDKYLKQITYCKSAIDMEVEGYVTFNFMIDENGKVVNVAVDDKLFPCLNRRVAKHVKNMPDWKPGMQGDRAVRTLMKLAIKFELED